jgi:hypothetical protein
VERGYNGGAYMRKLSAVLIGLVFILFSGVAFSSCASFVNWGKRVNFTMGSGLPLNGIDVSVSGIESLSDTITITDGFGDRYTTSWEFGEEDTVSLPYVAASLTIPVYWKDFNNGMGIETGIVSKFYLPHGGAGVYLEGSRGSIGVNASIGASISTGSFYKISTKPASPAWAGDPGIYINGDFHAPSSFRANVSVNETPSMGSIFSSVALKWHFIDWLYFEGGYTYYGETETKITGLSVDTAYTAERKYDMDGFISLTDRHIIYVGIGIGF